MTRYLNLLRKPNSNSKKKKTPKDTKKRNVISFKNVPERREEARRGFLSAMIAAEQLQAKSERESIRFFFSGFKGKTNPKQMRAKLDND
jgi:hypothetical protein